MKRIVLLVISGVLLLTGCSDQPTKLSGKIETIEVAHINWACDCADFIETKYFRNNPDYETKEEDCIFIEPANPKLKIPEDYYTKGYFDNNLKLTGQFYTDKGISDSYESKVSKSSAKKAKVFRYDSYKLIKQACCQ
ncbi:lipoprotein [Pseudoflavitalea sp. X16]|uniref:lipoprotein n=1 Tax=Paraflavitalea devenefica TaxID=2716334 RepID=UPI0014245481|nr:lipoprotein [Paraflavitalea devenefica]NII28751.1 lipoprotein [Paraflavitalea devenefica]